MSALDQYATTMAVLLDVLHERAEQDAKWGEQNHPDGTGPDAFVLRRTDINLDLRTGYELARIFRHTCDEKHKKGEGTWLDILLEEAFEASGEETPAALRRELIQVAAVAVAWVEAIDRRDGEA